MNTLILFIIIFLFLLILILLYKKYFDKDFKKLQESQNKLYKSKLFYSYILLYLIYFLFTKFYYTNYNVIYLFYSIFIVVSFGFGIFSSYKYGLLRGTLYFLIPVLLLMISLADFTKDSFFTLVITSFLFLAFYYGVFISGFFIVLSKNMKDNNINLSYMLAYLLGTAGIIFLLFVLKQGFDIYELNQLSKIAFNNIITNYLI